MRQTLFAIAALLLIASCKDDINDKGKRNQNWVWWVDAKTGKGVWIPVGDGKPIGMSGTYTTFYFNGHISEKGRLKNGKHVDSTFFYSINGERQGYMLYAMDSLNNQIQDTIAYFYNDGPIKMFREDSSIRAFGVIKNHTYGDSWTSYFKNGKLGFVKDLKKDTGWIVNYYRNGKVKDSDYAEGKNIYRLKYFYPTGQIEKSREFKNHGYNGLFKTYYLNGRLEGACPMINGKLNGRQVLWFEDGHLEEVGYVKDDLFNGPDTIYYESGKVKVIEYSIDNKRNGEFKKFDENGKLIVYVIAKDDKTIENKLAEQKTNSNQIRASNHK